MKKGLIIIFFFINFCVFSQIPQENLIGHWTGGISVAGTDTIILIGPDTVKLTNVDWPIDSGYIPLRTIATYKMKSISNTVDTAFWNHEIPPCVTHQDIDYNHQTFFKIADQELNADSTEKAETRISEIAIYSVAQSGDNLTALNSYFGVPVEQTSNVKWVDGSVAVTGTGTKASPYKTLNELRNQAFTKAYVKTGVYTESYSGLNWLPNRDGTYKSIGYVIVKGNVNTYGVCYPYNMSGTFEGFIFDAENARSFAMKTDRAGYTNIFNKCLFKNAATNAIVFSGATTNGQLNNCVINTVSDTYCVIGDGELIISGNLIYGNGSTYTIYATKASSISYNKITTTNTLTGIGVYGDYSHRIIYNILTGSHRYIILTGAASTNNNTVTIKGNIITPNISFYSLANINNVIETLKGWKVYILNNQITITNTSTWTATPDVSGIIYVYTPKEVFIKNNIIRCLNKIRWDCINLASDGTSCDTTNISNNYVKSNAKAGILLSVGGEGTTGTNQFNEALIYGNRIIGIYQDYPSEESVTIHGLLYNKSIDIDCKYNYISHVWGAIIPKSAGGGTNTKNGCYGNLISHVNVGIWARGIDGLKVYNNTIKSTIFNSEPLKVDDYSVQSQNVKFVNNLVYTVTSYPNYVVFFDDYSATHGCEVSNSLFYNINTSYFLSTESVNYSLSSAITANLASSITTSNPNMESNFWPETPITGAVLSSPYDIILDISTSWGSSTQVPVIYLKTQGTIFDIGAYKRSGNFVKTLDKKIIISNNKVLIIR